MNALLPGLVIVIPILVAAMIRIPFIARRRLWVDAMAVLAAVSVAVVAGWLCLAVGEAPVVHWVGAWAPQDGVAIGIALVADRCASGLVAVAAAVTAASLLFMWQHYETSGPHLQMMTLIFLGALSGFVLAGDLLTMFVFLELMGISSYIMTAFKVQDAAPLQAAFNVAVASTLGTFLFLLGAVLTYALAGTPNLAQVAERLRELEASPALATAFALLLAGLAVKAGLVPFHFGHADSHTTAPAPQAGLFSALLLQTVLFGLARILHVMMQAPEVDASALKTLIVGAGAATAVIAAVMSLLQMHLKRLLAFSGIAHLGIAAIGVGLLEADGVAGAGLYVASHAAVKMALFLGAGILIQRFGTMELGEIAGSGRGSWLLVAVFLLGGLALAGAPPSGLYAGKGLIEEAARKEDMVWVMGPIYFAAILTGAAAIRVVWPLLRTQPPRTATEACVQEGARETRAGAEHHALTGWIALPAGLLLIGSLLPLIPGLAHGCQRAADAEFDRQRYTAAVLAEPLPPPAVPLRHDLWKREDLWKGGGVAALAALAGLLLVEPRRLQAYCGWLRSLHNGHVSDYVAWLSVGVVLAAAWLRWRL
jgi:multicomponent Na+:H+ antiporter subunit D